MKSVLITGGFGYVGGRLATALLNHGVEVRISTRRNPAQIPEWATGNTARGHVTWGSDIAHLCEGADAVVHLAAPNEVAAASDPEACIADTNALTEAALAGAKEAGVERFLYFSTIHVYGQLLGRMHEDLTPEPSHPYAIAHAESENLVRAAAGTDMKAVIFRLSNGYGAPCDALADRWSLLVNDLCRQAVTTGRLQLKTSGQQKRDFITLEDVCAASLHFLRAPTWEDRSQIYNVSSGTSIRILDMARKIQQLAETVLETEITLEVAAKTDVGAANEFVISNEKLLRHGVHLENKQDEELNALLTFCHDTFH